ncbi:TolC family protein [Flavobacteriaceae bacterium F08102]|nr:TolC family protein [Flavobacteriaceae bacterium F08102]
MRIILTYLLLAISIKSVAQTQILTKSEAVKIALENNYGIKIAENNVRIAENNQRLLNSGFLPTLSASGGTTFNLNNSTAEFSSGTTTTVNGAESSSYNAAINLNYTLFDGQGRKYNYERLKTAYNLSELQARETIENTVFQLFTVYFNVARLAENVALFEQSLQISKERLTRVKYMFDYGQSTKLAVLNAEVDVNNDSIVLLNSRQQLINAKRDLNVVLGNQQGPDFTVVTEVDFSLHPDRETLYEQVLKNNVVLKQIDQQILISDFQLKANKSGYLPTLGLTGSYGWNKNNNNAASNVLYSTNSGFSGGLNLRWNLFDGGSTKTNVQNAKIEIENQQLIKAEAILQIETDFNNAWEDYQNKLFILKTQEKNVQTNQNNFNRTEEQFKLGQINSLEFRQAQINLINAENNKNAAKYDAKLAELKILQLSGNILNTAF